MGQLDEKSVKAFTELMVEKIESMKDNWEKPWISTKGKAGIPINIDGRRYSGMNSLMLFLISERNNYNLPVFLTFNQAKNNNAMINKGEKSFPVVFWNLWIKNKETGKTISSDDYDKLTIDEKEKYRVIPYMKHFDVFNIDQTNLKKTNPELYQKIADSYKMPPLKDENGMFKSPEMDKLISENKWLCPIKLQQQDSAYFSPKMDYIMLPLKAQFKDGESFYATALHEMAHSTGVESRLDRKDFRDYGKEELVAELTAAVTAQTIGISTNIREENVQYLKGWLENIKKEPDFLFSILSDVNKASNMISTEVEKMSLSQDVKEDSVLSAITVLENNLKSELDPDVSLKIEKVDGETNDFEVSTYGRDGIYLGDIKGTKQDNSWYLTTDTSIVIMVPQNQIDFMNKNLYGSTLTNESLSLRDATKTMLSLSGNKDLITNIQVTNPLNKGYMISAAINGEQQVAERLSEKDYLSLKQGNTTALDLAKKYYQPTIELNKLLNENTKITR